MSKVTLTQSQANQIKYFLKEDPVWSKEKLITYASEEGFETSHAKCLNDLEVGELAKAVYEGYEVEPQFEVSDVVVVQSEDEGDALFQVFDTSSNKSLLVRNSIKRIIAPIDDIRHATELEKQLFALGRTEPKLKHGDVIGTDWGCFYLVSQLTDLSHSTLSLNEASRYLRQDKVLDIYPIEHRIEVGES